MEILKPYTILENLNWKGIFKDGQLFIYSFEENLKGYIVKGLCNEKKIKLITRFLLKEDIDKCKIIDKSELLQPYIEKNLKCVV